jgi:putative membrane protein
MALLTDADRERVSAAIAAVERRTDAELVTVLARRSAQYVHFPVLWAALVALASPSVIALLPHWLEGHHVFFLQWVIFGVLAVALQLPLFARHLVPRAVLRAEAANMARRQFLENGLTRTRGRTGVLIFVSEFEHYVEVLADEGISAHVSSERWADIVATFIKNVRAGRTLDGFVGCIESCGALLAEHVPVTDQKNELPDHLRVIG